MNLNIQALVESYEDREWDFFLAAIEDLPTRKAAEISTITENMGDNTEKWSRAAIVSCMQELDELGFARFIKGARGKETRLEWIYPPKAIAAAARGDTEELEDLVNPVAELEMTTKMGDDVMATFSLTELVENVARQFNIQPSQIRLSATIGELIHITAMAQGIPRNKISVRIG